MRYRKFQQVKKVRWPVGNLTFTDFNRPRQEKKPVVIKKKRNPTGNGNKKKRNKNYLIPMIIGVNKSNYTRNKFNS